MPYAEFVFSAPVLKEGQLLGNDKTAEVRYWEELVREPD